MNRSCEACGLIDTISVAARLSPPLSGLRMRLPSFSILQYFSFVITICAALALNRWSEQGEIIWRTGSLTYTEPKIPSNFDQNGRGKPLMYYSISSQPIEYPDGRSLYIHFHRGGWEHCRKLFYEEQVLHRGGHQIFSPLPKDEWVFDHQLSAINDGYDACCEQLQYLLTKYSKKQLADEIGYSINWVQAPLIFAFFAGLFGVAIFRPKFARQQCDGPKQV